jgi:hypothetical protein
MKLKRRGFGTFTQMNRWSPRQAQNRLMRGWKFFTVFALLSLLIVPSYPFPLPLPQTNEGTTALPKRIVGRRQNKVPKHIPPARQIIYAPIIGLEGFGEAELVLNNNSPKPMEVTPTFYTVEGDPMVGKRLTLKPAEVRHVAVAALILPEHQGQAKMGGMALTYFGGMLELGTQITLLGQGRAGSVDIPFSSERDYRSPVQEAVWWMPDKGVATIILGNASDEPILVNLRSSTSESQDVQLGPHATEVLHPQHTGQNDSPSSSGGAAESLRLEVLGPIGSLRATGFITSEDQSFTSTIRFYDPQMIRQPHLFATHFRVKDTVPHLVLKNTTDAPISARPRFLPLSSESGGFLELLLVTVEPHQAIEVDLEPLMAAVATRSDLDVVSVQVVNEGGRVGLISALCSTNPSTGTTYDVPLRDSGSVRNSTGSYPWRVDGDYSTIISITNVGDKPAKFIVTINHERRKYVLNPQELAVGETAVFDMNKIRDKQIPDRNRNVIPRSALVGQFRWSVIGGDGTARLMGRSEVVSASRRVSSTYSCPVCCPWSFADLLPDPGSFIGPPGGLTNIYVDGVWVDCYGSLTPRYPYPYGCDWSSDNPSVISVSPSFGISTTARCMAEGQTLIWAHTVDFVYYDDGMDCYAFDNDFYGDCMGEVKCDLAITKFRYNGQQANPFGGTLDLNPDDCDDSQDSLIVADFVSSDTITQIVSLSCYKTGTNPEVRILGCDAMVGSTGSGGTIDIFFRAKKKPGAQNAGIGVQLKVRCGNVDSNNAGGGVTVRCP